MQIFSTEFLSALLAIVVIDLVLAGDNAIVIALAARRLPQALQRRAVICGAAGAVAVRSALTIGVVWLLHVPGLLFAGGAALIWIAYRLLLPEADDTPAAHVAPVNGFWAAIRTIVAADVMMGLDNVLAVAGAAHGSFLLVVLGLLISVPIVVWGSTLLMKLVERFPAFVYIGAGVLAWTAAKMMVAEPLFAAFYSEHRPVAPLMTLLIVTGVLWAGFAKNHRRLESRISARLRHAAGSPPFGQIPTGGNAMLKLLVPADGSPNSLHAGRHIANLFLTQPQLEVHLLNVQPPFSRHVARFLSRKNLADYHREQGERALRPMRERLGAHGVPCHVHIHVGDKAALIAESARRLDCDRIVMATARKNSLTRMLEDSVTNRVLELTTVPVEVIAGDAVSMWERWGLPAGIGAAVALLLMAAD